MEVGWGCGECAGLVSLKFGAEFEFEFEFNLECGIASGGNCMASNELIYWRSSSRKR